MLLKLSSYIYLEEIIQKKLSKGMIFFEKSLLMAFI